MVPSQANVTVPPSTMAARKVVSSQFVTTPSPETTCWKQKRAKREALSRLLLEVFINSILYSLDIPSNGVKYPFALGNRITQTKKIPYAGLRKFLTPARAVERAAYRAYVHCRHPII